MKTNPNDAAIKSLAHYNGSEIKTGLTLAKMLTAYEENKDIVVREMTNIGVNEPERNFSNPNNWSASFYLTSRWEIKIPPKKVIITRVDIERIVNEGIYQKIESHNCLEFFCNRLGL